MPQNQNKFNLLHLRQYNKKFKLLVDPVQVVFQKTCYSWFVLTATFMARTKKNMKTWSIFWQDMSNYLRLILVKFSVFCPYFEKYLFCRAMKIKVPKENALEKIRPWNNIIIQYSIWFILIKIHQWLLMRLNCTKTWMFNIPLVLHVWIKTKYFDTKNMCQDTNIFFHSK